MEDQISNLKEYNYKIKQKLNNKQLKINGLKQDYKEKCNEVELLSQNKNEDPDKLFQELNDIKCENEDLKKENDGLLVKLNDLTNGIIQLQEQLEEMFKEKEILKNKVDQLQGSSMTIGDNPEDDELQQCKEVINQLKDEINKLEFHCAELEQQVIPRLEEQNENLIKEIEELEYNLEQDASDMKLLREKYQEVSLQAEKADNQLMLLFLLFTEVEQLRQRQMQQAKQLESQSQLHQSLVESVDEAEFLKVFANRLDKQQQD